MTCITNRPPYNSPPSPPRCVACIKQLLPGDEFALRDDGLYCRQDFDAVEKKALAENTNTTNISHNDLKGNTTKMKKKKNEMKWKALQPKSATTTWKVTPS